MPLAVNGSDRADMRRRVLERYGERCWLCGMPIHDDAWHIDHVIPSAAGGSDALSNLRPAHARCNLSRGTKQPALTGEALWQL